MAMSKKHYKAVAKAINDTFIDYADAAPVARKAIALVAARVALVFKGDNTNFDMQRFVEACCKSEKQT